MIIIPIKCIYPLGNYHVYICIYIYYIYSLNRYIYFIIYNNINFVDQYIDGCVQILYVHHLPFSKKTDLNILSYLIHNNAIKEKIVNDLIF